MGDWGAEIAVAQAAGMHRVLVVVGMEDERAIAAGEGVDVVVGGANATRLRQRLASVDPASIEAVYSFGVAGAMDDGLSPGELLLSTRVVAQRTDANSGAGGAQWPADPTLRKALQARAQRSKLGSIREAVFLGSDLEARDNPHAGGDALHGARGAAIIDNESHLAAEFAQQHGVPFVAVRAVSDAVSRRLPPAALLALRDDGSPDVAAIVKSVLHHPGQLPALVRTARDYKRALDALRAFRREVGFVPAVHCHREA